MSPLHHVGEFLRELLLRVPLGLARGLFVATLLALLLWVWLLPSSQTRPPHRPPRPSENLKLWAGLALLIQIAIYCWL